MLQRLISICLHQRLFILIALVLLVLGGAYSVKTLPLDAFPDVSGVQVEVLSSAPGLSALEVEKFVTFPVEVAMRSLPKLTQTRSVSRFGLSVITVVFDDAMDIYLARQLVFERLGEVKEKLPAGVESRMGPVTTALGEIYQYTLEGASPGLDEKSWLTEQRTVQEWVVAPLLKSVPGVSEVNAFGGYSKEYQVLIDQDRLAKYDLPLKDVLHAVEGSTLNVGGSFLEKHSQQYIIRGVGLVRTTGDLEKTVLRSARGSAVFLRDVATVKIGQAVRQGAALMNGKGEVVGGIVMMTRGSNSREVVRAVKRKVDEINGGGILPGNLRIRPCYDRTDIVRSATGTLTEALAEGAFFILVVLYLFLRNFRGAAVVISTLVLIMLCSALALKASGMTVNLMSLGGLIISMGMIIDSAVIQVENVQRHLCGRSDDRLGTVLRAVMEVRTPSILGELIMALTFVPLFALQGIEGKMFSPLAVTVLIALFSSMVLSVFVVPVICLAFSRPQEEKASFCTSMAAKLYLPLLKRALRRKGRVLAGALVVLALGLAAIPLLGTEFMPVMDEGAFDMDTRLLAGVSLPRALEVNRQAQKILMGFPELETVVGKTGQTEIALDAKGVESTGLVGILRPKREWKSARTTAELMDKMRESLRDVPGFVFSFSQPIQCRIDELVAGTRSQIVIRLFGDDLDVLGKKAEALGAVVSSCRGVEDLMVEQVAGQPYISLALDRDRLALYGLGVDEVQETIRTALAGTAVNKVYEGDRSFDIVVRFGEKTRDSQEAMGNLLVDVPGSGARIPLRQLADIEEVEGPVAVGREFGTRRILVQCNVHGRDIGSFVAECKAKIKAKVSLPPGYYITWGGQFENQERAMKRLSIIVPAVAVLIFLLLFMTFGSLQQAALVMLNLPFALVGGVFALLATGLYLSVPASIGFIALFGVAVLNGVVLISCISQLQEEGLPLEEAIVQGCERRMRPVLMTAAITVLSLVPLLFASGPGSEIQRPLAAVVVGGLITSTVLTLFILPVLYGAFQGRAAENGGG